MSGFSADWLTLREPLDAESRAQALSASFAARVRRSTDGALEIVDLGAGTGANLRYLAPLFGGAQHWRLLDDDPALLDALARRTAEWAEARGARCARDGARLAVEADGMTCRVDAERADLAGDVAALALPSRGIVTASALLDLVSAEWLEGLAASCRAANASALFALTYDGRMQCLPEEPLDALVLRLFNEHQRGDKGFGRALGPAAAAAAERAFRAHGYVIENAPSDWRIGAAHAALQAELLDGWRRAAAEVAPQHADALASWHAHRRAQIASGALTLVVGHTDLALHLP